jgi:hypothetical protein
MDAIKWLLKGIRSLSQHKQLLLHWEEKMSERRSVDWHTMELMHRHTHLHPCELACWHWRSPVAVAHLQYQSTLAVSAAGLHEEQDAWRRRDQMLVQRECLLQQHSWAWRQRTSAILTANFSAKAQGGAALVSYSVWLALNFGKGWLMTKAATRSMGGGQHIMILSVMGNDLYSISSVFRFIQVSYSHLRNC